MSSNVVAAAGTPAVDTVLPVGGDGGASSLTVAPADKRTTFTIPFTFDLSMAHPDADLCLASEAEFLKMVILFESVQLLELSGNITIFPGSGRRVAWCFAGTDTCPSDTLKGPIAGLASGGSYGTTTTPFLLPAGHSFGKELKGVNVGNPYPRLFFQYVGGTDGTSTTDVHIRGAIKIAVAGTGIIKAF